jgi:TatD DNase family protein
LLTDTHCHLNLPEFEQDLDQVIRSARDSGLKKILVPGIDLPSSQRAVELANAYPGLIYAAVGIHPNYSTAKDSDLLDEFRFLLEKPSVVAVGEIGLDFYRDFTQKSDQIATFRRMLDLSSEFGKPVCLHQRDSLPDLLESLETWHSRLKSQDSELAQHPGVFHSYGGDEMLQTWASESNFYFGISGYITFKKAESLRESLAKIDPARLLVETDAPYISPEPLRGKRNEPANVALTMEKLAEVLNNDPGQIEKISGENASRLFGWQ